MTRTPLLLVLPLLLLAACDRGALDGDRRAHDDPALPPLDQGVVAALPEGVPEETAREGAELYARSCAVCHGPDAGGTQLAPTLTGAAWSRIEAAPEALEQLIRDGIAQPGDYPVPMPPRGGGDFDDAQIRAVAAYVVALHRSSAPAPPPAAGATPPPE